MTNVTHKPYKSRGFMGWLGRQVAHVRHAIHADVTPAAPSPAGDAGAPPGDDRIVYRAVDTQEQPHPTRDGLALRRTTIDEVVILPPAGDASPARHDHERNG